LAIQISHLLNEFIAFGADGRNIAGKGGKIGFGPVGSTFGCVAAASFCGSTFGLVGHDVT
jgi:hypothetical protein